MGRVGKQTEARNTGDWWLDNGHKYQLNAAGQPEDMGEYRGMDGRSNDWLNENVAPKVDAAGKYIGDRIASGANNGNSAANKSGPGGIDIQGYYSNNGVNTIGPQGVHPLSAHKLNQAEIAQQRASQQEKEAGRDFAITNQDVNVKAQEIAGMQSAAEAEQIKSQMQGASGSAAAIAGMNVKTPDAMPWVARSDKAHENAITSMNDAASGKDYAEERKAGAAELDIQARNTSQHNAASEDLSKGPPPEDGPGPGTPIPDPDPQEQPEEPKPREAPPEEPTSLGEASRNAFKNLDLGGAEDDPAVQDVLQRINAAGNYLPASHPLMQELDAALEKGDYEHGVSQTETADRYVQNNASGLLADKQALLKGRLDLSGFEASSAGQEKTVSVPGEGEIPVISVDNGDGTFSWIEKNQGSVSAGPVGGGDAASAPPAPAGGAPAAPAAGSSTTNNNTSTGGGGSDIRIKNVSKKVSDARVKNIISAINRRF